MFVRAYGSALLQHVRFFSISKSNGSSKTVPRTHYYRLPMWPVMCVTKKCDGPTNTWVVRCLSWKTIIVPWFGRDYWHGGHADNSNKTANNAKYSSCKGVESRDLWRQPTKFAIATILNFVSTSNFISIHSPSVYKKLSLFVLRFYGPVNPTGSCRARFTS